MPFNRLIASYISDWLIIAAAISISLALSTVNPDYHPFSLLDLTISYPHRQNPKLTLGTFISLSIILPFSVIVLVSLFLPPDPTLLSTPPPPRSSRRNRIWTLNATLLGLGVSLATATIVSTGVKNLTGIPRPDFLQRCDPDVTRVPAHTVGAAYGRQALSNLWVLVEGGVCRQKDRAWLNDGFKSFPSGYAAIAFAGLWYLTLFLSNRFGIVPPSPSTGSANGRARDDTALMRNEEAGEPLMETSALQTAECHSEDKRDNAAARPAFLLCLPYIPLGLAVFIAGTRYFDFRNHGFDVLAGSGIGTVTAWFGFSLYHPPLSSGRRGAWGPRGREGAFGVGGV